MLRFQYAIPLGVFALFIQPANATTVTLSFGGEVSRITESGVSTGVEVGDDVSGSFTFDTDDSEIVQTSVSSTGERSTIYGFSTTGLGQELSFSIGDSEWNSTESLRITVTDNSVNRQGITSDSLTFGALEITESTEPISNPDFMFFRVGEADFSGGTPTFVTSDDIGEVIDADYSDGGATGGIQVSGSGFSYNIGLALDASSFGVDVEEPPSPPTEPEAVVFLDFDGAVGEFFELQKVSILGFELNQEHYVAVDGAINSSNLHPDVRDQIVQEVQSIFNEAGISVLITQDEPMTDDYLTVEFGRGLDPYDANGDGSATTILAGRAYDTTRLYDEIAPWVQNYGIDRFNQRDDGHVAIFLDVDDGYTAKQIAETAAHEIAHSYGGMHVDPLSGGIEVLDYSPNSGSEQFYSEVTPVVDFSNGGEQLGDLTHNPVYHFRRYVNNENPSDIELGAGNWDVGSVESYLISINVGSFLSEVDRWYIGFEDLTSYEIGESGFGYSLLDITSEVIGDGFFEFASSVDSVFAILAGNEQGVINYFAGPSVGDVFSSTQDILTADFSFFRSGEINIDRLGEFQITASLLSEVPAPPAGLLFASTLLWFRKRGNK